ncbi:MAG: MiaB/RimO family radical SAM methylthiotransferase, partial [Acidobacteriota bacterium]
TGCYATDSRDEAGALEGVDLVVTNDRKEQLLDAVHNAFPELRPASEGIPVPYVPLDVGLARALVKVEDGCNMRCSFCIIPSTRGRQRSRTVDEAVDEVQALADGGYAEVVITGVQISEYDDDGRRLFDLVTALLERTEIPRIRLTSLAPWKFDHRLLDLWSDPRLCRHIHMSLQSGSTSTLRRMRRPYSAQSYAELADTLRRRIPGLALTTDVIVGFPGEDDREFQESLEFTERMAFARPHFFTYSTRAGTHAADLPNPVEPAVKKERMRAMLEVGARSQRAFWRGQLGEEADVIWEHDDGDSWSGLTDHYIRVFAEAPRARLGGLGRVRLDRLADRGVFATAAD